MYRDHLPGRFQPLDFLQAMRQLLKKIAEHHRGEGGVHDNGQRGLPPEGCNMNPNPTTSVLRP